MTQPEGSPESDDQLIAPLSRELTRSLTSGETVRLNVHQHPMVLWKPVAILLAALVVTFIFVSDGSLPRLVLLGLVVAIGNLIWHVLERRHNSFAVSTRRVMRVEGLINRSVPMMRLTKVTDMRLDQPLVGRLLGYGTITIESAGQDQSIRELTYAPHPTQVFRRLNSIIFNEEMPPDPGSSGRAGRFASASRRGARRAGRAAGKAVTRIRPSAPSQQGRTVIRYGTGEAASDHKSPIEHSPQRRRRRGPDTTEIPVRRRPK